jgi:hypothetical protein
MNIHKELEAWRARDPENRAYDIDLAPGDNTIELRAMYGSDYLELTATTEENPTWEDQVEILTSFLKDALTKEAQWRTGQMFEALAHSATLMIDEMLETFGQSSGKGYTPYLRQLGSHQ